MHTLKACTQEGGSICLLILTNWFDIVGHRKSDVCDRSVTNKTHENTRARLEAQFLSVARATKPDWLAYWVALTSELFKRNIKISY